ncbi:hypothetical protein DFJ67_2226 [Asanoa ferruginea]|uniref:PknH-like protein n=1 Tax=Asanoa ferruginea TaxID=53367 RepID=A0A3D9ZHC1_9ACTN|nr:hypothetical protein [Asanoa ferruginea]REF96249.1 hypothetical protein DFJ67_2226 [Asanoa ferruginea]GIF46899.1 hypothetical protein Afe04nite_14380 [Asanoa ferruginea]
MTDQQLDELFARFRAGPPLAAPAGAHAARLVSRRRRRSQTVAAGVLTAVAVGLPSVGLAAGVFDRPPVKDGALIPSAAPMTDVTGPGAALPAVAMLRESDLPAGYRHLVPQVSEDPQAGIGGRCFGREPLGNARRVAQFMRGDHEFLQQVVTRMDSAAAAQDWLDALPDVLRGDCVPSRITVADSGFAGAGSLLIQARSDIGEPGFYLLVRQGPLITLISQQDQTDPAALVELGRVAADRLCAGTSSC